MIVQPNKTKAPAQCNAMPATFLSVTVSSADGVNTTCSYFYTIDACISILHCNVRARYELAHNILSFSQCKRSIYLLSESVCVSPKTPRSMQPNAIYTPTYWLWTNMKHSCMEPLKPVHRILSESHHVTKFNSLLAQCRSSYEYGTLMMQQSRRDRKRPSATTCAIILQGHAHSIRTRSSRRPPILFYSILFYSTLRVSKCSCWHRCWKTLVNS